MNAPLKLAPAAAILTKADPDQPALIATGARSIAVRAGTDFCGCVFREQTPVEIQGGALVTGAPSLPSAAASGPDFSEKDSRADILKHARAC